ncbi:MAG: helix-turn-helix domain-containing protein [Solirubrobacteraceae bacterium]
MPEIGATLREARMRARIDVSEIEADTKIRAKYLRALENEEWDLLPGPTYVKSFLRTYAEALGLDAKLLVDEYKLRHEHLSEVELQPINAAAPGRERRRTGPVIPRGVTIGLIFALLLIALYALGNSGDEAPTTARTQTTPAASGDNAPVAGTPAKPRPKRVRLQLIATGQVYVCLKDGNRTLIDGKTLQAGDRTGTYRSRRFRLSLGNANVKLRINGRERGVPRSSDSIGLEITQNRGRQPLNKQRRAYCE